LAELAWCNAARNPSRSAMTVGLMATATFLIVAMSSFRLSPTSTGTGGFDLIGECAEPLFADLSQLEAREELLMDRAGVLAGSEVFGMRLREGDDASCNNLYRPRQPRILGVTRQWIEHFDRPGGAAFRWSASDAKTAEEQANPWRLLLDTPAPRSAAEPIPVVIDMNTAMYSLQLLRGVRSEYAAVYDGRNVRFQVVGLLDNSVLQGSLLIGERDFERLFPNIGGYRYFMLRTPAGQRQQVAGLLEDRLGDLGFDVVSAESVLAQLLAVQNTYLSTFQSLGALGLLLGTFGLAAVQLRNVVERRGELALMRATGFRRRRLAHMVLLENLLLLVGGLGTGTLAAMLAVIPLKLTGEGAFPFALVRDLLVLLAAVMLVGVLSGLATVRSVVRTPLLAALRGD
jgi:hypothetical protein